MPMPAITRIAGIRPVQVGKGADRQSADRSADRSHRDDFHNQARRRELVCQRMAL
jgi:hypothetical protein